MVGERDVMDTWMDSSITAAVHAGWPDSMDERLFPADLQPNGYDIIRTWDYYLIVRGVALFGKSQFKTALINGMVLKEGKMMHKSYGNYVPLMEAIEKYGADAFRLWAATAAKTGMDINFTWGGLEYARRFLTKLWNIARYVSIAVAGEEVPERVEEGEFRLLDRWILNEVEKLTSIVTKALEEFDFQTAALSIIDFTWHKFADHYIEATKYRIGGGKYKRSAIYTLYYVLFRVIHLLSVFAPHICEELYHRMFKNRMGYESITVIPWPEAKGYDEEVIKHGDIVVQVIATIRRAKQDARIPLSKELNEVVIHAGDYAPIIQTSIDDIRGTIRAKTVIVKEERLEREERIGERYRVERYPEIVIEIG